MYRHCIYCSADLGSNDSVEAFPVGRNLAFDAAKGRLWAVCGACARWNLALLEERWEAIEAAERLFAGSRLRVQRENVGMAKLRGGTTLVRVGAALPGELAVWRYGGQLRARRSRSLKASAAATALGVGLALAGAAVTAAGAAAACFGYDALVKPALRRRRANRVVHLAHPGTPGTAPVAIRRWHVEDAYLRAAEGGDGVELHVPGVLEDRVPLFLGLTRVADARTLVLSGGVARAVLGRALVHVNERGATGRQVERAVAQLAGAGSPEGYMRRLAATEARLVDIRATIFCKAPVMPTEARLALEMALHEESERRALEGELRLLESAWREAEALATIADGLAAPVLPRSGAMG